MTLITLMYHHARAGRHGNAADMLDRHFAFIARHCRCVLPGDALDRSRLNVCLTFDDGYRDFHETAFPLLVRHGLQAVLAVPGGVIPEHRRETMSSSDLHDHDERQTGRGAALRDLCTWAEIKAMADSRHVRIAAHGFSHRRLDDAAADLHTELVVAKTLIAGHIDHAVDSFFFPFGRFSPAALRAAKRHYRYVFRIGGADNADWDGRLLYRIDADRMGTPDALFTRRRRSAYTLRRHWNRLRGR